MYQRYLFSVFIVFSLIFYSCTDTSSTVDQPPEILTQGRFSAFIGEDFSLIIDTDDPQGLPVEVIAKNLPPWLTFFPDGARMSGLPTEMDAGLYQIEVEATNGTHSYSATIQVQVFVNQTEATFQNAIDEMVRTRTPGLQGLAVSVIDTDQNLYRAFTGTHGSGFNAPAVDHTNLFRVASVTKPMTTAIVLKLVEEGVLSLDDKLADHYETLLPNSGSMTIRQILSHTAGVFDHLNSNSFWGHPSFSPTKIWTVDEIVEFARNNGPLFSPGSGYGYSNTAFYVLGALIEEVTGLNLSDAYTQYVFEPLGLENILYDNFSTSSNPIDGLSLNPRSYEYHLTAVSSAGAIAANPTDVAEFGRMFYGGRFLSDELTSKLNENIGADFGGQNYGLGTRIWDIGGIPHHGHTGALLDYRNILMYIPETDLTISIHTQDVHSNWFVLVDEIFDFSMSHFSAGAAKALPFVYGSTPRE